MHARNSIHSVIFSQLAAKPATMSRDRRGHSRLGFSLTELLVVIGIIVLLIGILLVAMGAVQKQARKARTLSTMNAFASACQTFQLENGKYPGVIPDDVILNNPSGGPPLLSSTENALLDLNGGARVLSPFDPPGGQTATDYANFRTAANSAGSMIELIFGTSGWQLVIDKRKIGDGPVINGKAHGPYFTAKGDELRRVPGQLSDPPGDRLPDLVDAWGTPIIYFRQARDRGPLLLDPGAATVQAQFTLGGVADYLGWPMDLAGNVITGNPLTLGELGRPQVWNMASNPVGSVLTAGPPGQPSLNFARVIRHSGVSPKADGSTGATSVLYGSPKGAFGLISAGADGIYFSAADGPGSQGSTVTNIGPMDSKVLDEYDDIVMFGGG